MGVFVQFAGSSEVLKLMRLDPTDFEILQYDLVKFDNELLQANVLLLVIWIYHLIQFSLDELEVIIEWGSLR